MKAAHSPFELTSRDGHPIRGDVRIGPAPQDTAIVICHGFKGFKDWGFFPHLAEQLVERTGLPTIAFNFSGSGIGPDLESFTELDRFQENTFSKELDDLGIVLDAAARGELPGLPECPRTGLFGHSRGGGTAVIRASEDERVRCLVTWSAICQVDRWSDADKDDWRREGKLEVLNSRTGQMMPLGLELLRDVEENADRLDVLAAASRLRVPYLIVHGTHDESVDVREAEALADAAPPETTRLETIEGAGHTFGAAHPFGGATDDLERAIELTADWFERHIGA